VELYNWLLLGHILAAITWVGGAITMQMVGARLIRAESAEAVAGFTRTIEWIGPRLYGPQAKRIAEGLRAEGAISERARRLIGRVFVVGRFDLALLLLILVDMVLKPGV
jgi:hypothetical protein